MMDEEIRQALNEVREMKQMCGNINMKLTNIVTQRGQDFKKKLEAEYQRGFEDGKWKSEDGCTGCKYEGKVVTGPPCISCCNSYKNQWTAKDDKIEVGDEVRGTNGTEKLIITAIESEYDHCVVMTKRGGFYTANLSSLVKTGRHFDIASILEGMRND
jgi:hypothetical protein